MKKTLCVLAIFLGPAAAQADPISISFLYRSAYAAGTIGDISLFEDNSTFALGEDGERSAAVTVALFDASASGFGSVEVDVGRPQLVSASGSSLATAGAAESLATGIGQSAVTLNFLLTSAHTFLFQGEFTAGTSGESDAANSVWFAYLGSPTSVERLFFESGGASGRIVRTGTLNPGTYYLDASAFSGISIYGGGANLREGRAFASFDYTLSLSEIDAAPVPEPASLLLVGTGLAGAWIRRRRQKRAY